MKNLGLYVGGVLLLASLSAGATAVTVTQQVLAPQKVNAPLIGSTAKTFSFNSSATTGTFVMQVGDGKDLTAVKCT